MEEMAKNPPPPLTDPNRPREKSLVEKLGEGDHRVEASLRPEKTAKALKDRIDMGYVHIKFTETKGGAKLGVGLDGELTLDFVKVRCVADIDLKTLAGKGHLVRV